MRAGRQPGDSRARTGRGLGEDRKGRKKTITSTFVAENGSFGTPFLTPKIPPKMFMWVPFLRSFPGKEAHKFFWGSKKGGLYIGSIWHFGGFPKY